MRLGVHCPNDHRWVRREAAFLEPILARRTATLLTPRPLHEHSHLLSTGAHHARYDIAYDVRAVLDRDVIVAAMRSATGASAAIVRAMRRGRPTLLLSVALALEYEAVRSQAEDRLAAGLSAQEAGIFVTAAIAMAEPVRTHFLWRPQLRDAGDEMVLEAAANGRAMRWSRSTSETTGRCPRNSESRCSRPARRLPG
jgi:predicted nucleic acid-binding protein